MLICPRSRLGTLHGVPGSTIDEEVDNTTPIAVLTAPRFCLGTHIHDDADTNTTVIVSRCVHGHGITPSLLYYHNLLCGIQRIHDDEDRMIIRGSWC